MTGPATQREWLPSSSTGCAMARAHLGAHLLERAARPLYVGDCLAVQQLQRPPVGLQISNCISFDLRSDEKHSRPGCWRRGQRADLRGYSGAAILIGEAEQN